MFGETENPGSRPRNWGCLPEHIFPCTGVERTGQARMRQGQERIGVEGHDRASQGPERTGLEGHFGESLGGDGLPKSRIGEERTRAEWIGTERRG